MCDNDILWQAYIQDIKTASHPHLIPPLSWPRTRLLSMITVSFRSYKVPHLAITSKYYCMRKLPSPRCRLFLAIFCVARCSEMECNHLSLAQIYTTKHTLSFAAYRKIHVLWLRAPVIDAFAPCTCSVHVVRRQVTSLVPAGYQANK